MSDQEREREELARTLCQADPCGGIWEYESAEVRRDYLKMADAVLPLIREAEARAWDEGHEAGAHNVAAADDRDASFQDNPYREGVRRAGQ